MQTMWYFISVTSPTIYPRWTWSWAHQTCDLRNNRPCKLRVVWPHGVGRFLSMTHNAGKGNDVSKSSTHSQKHDSSALWSQRSFPGIKKNWRIKLFPQFLVQITFLVILMCSFRQINRFFACAEIHSMASYFTSSDGTNNYFTDSSLFLYWCI